MRKITTAKLSAVRYGFGYCLYVPKRLIPAHSERSVFEFEVTSVAGRPRTFSLFASHEPQAVRAYLDLFCLHPDPGERFLVGPIRELDCKGFADAYNRQKPVALKDTEMRWDGHHLSIWLAGQTEIPLNGSRLDSYQGRAVLHGRLGRNKEDAVTISVGLPESTIKLSRRRPVTSITRSGMDIVLGYKNSNRDSRVRLRLFDSTSQETRREGDHRIGFEPAEIEVDRPIQREEIAARLVFNEEARYRAWKYWAMALSHNERKGHQGDIGEAVACAVNEKSGYKVLERHTVKSRIFKPRHQSRERGRDVLAGRDGEYYVAEVKHWTAHPRIAIREAQAELRKFDRSPERKRLERRLGVRIKGGFAMQLEWSYKSSEALLRSKYVNFSH